LYESRFTETQIIKAIKALEAGKDVVEICREMGVHKATLYSWRKKYGGMEVNQKRNSRPGGAGMLLNGPEFVSHELCDFCRG
jgi:hypothetical protein